MPIDASNISPIRPLNLTPTRLSDEMLEKLRSFEAMAYQTINMPADENYSQVMVGGKVIATLTNNGYAVTSNAMGDGVRNLLRDEGGYEGPELAQHRAEQIAKAFGGTIVKAETAQTQSEWNSRPAPHGRWIMRKWKKTAIRFRRNSGRRLSPVPNSPMKPLWRCWS